MKFLTYLIEEYYKLVRAGCRPRQAVEVFNFPSKKEVREFRDLRFTIDIPKRKFLVWDANSMLLHDEVSKGFIEIRGICAQRSGKFIFLSGKVKSNPDYEDYKIYFYGDANDIKAIKDSDFFEKILRYFDEHSKDIFTKFIENPRDMFT